MSALTAIQARKSVRAYTDRSVEEEKLETVLQAGNCAPIHGRLHMTVIENPLLLNEIDTVTLNKMKHSGNEFLMQRASIEGYHPLYGAPVLVLLSAPNGNDSFGFNMANAACAAENMLIAATELGLGSCFIMSAMMAFADSKLLQKTGIHEGFVPLCGVLLGYGSGTGPAEERTKKDNINYCR